MIKKLRVTWWLVQFYFLEFLLLHGERGFCPVAWCYRLNQSTHQSNSSNCSVLRKCVQYFLLEITKSLKDLERNEYEIFWSSLALFIRNPFPFILYRQDFISSYLTEYDEGNIGKPVKWNGSHVYGGFSK